MQRFFRFSPRADGTLGLVAADVSGKGIAASLVMASVKGRLPLVAESAGVAETLAGLNRSLAHELGRREFVALCYLRYRPASGEFELADAGPPDPYLLADGGPPRPLQVPGARLPLGIKADIAYESLSGRLEVGQRLLLITDGLPEAPLPDGAPLGYPALERLLGQGEGSPEDWLGGLFGRLEERVGTSLDDDWTALLLERSAQREGGARHRLRLSLPELRRAASGSAARPRTAAPLPSIARLSSLFRRVVARPAPGRSPSRSPPP